MGQVLTLDALEVIDAIDRKGSFAAAAAALYRVPSAVTYAVHKLEQDLGVELFRRQGRRSVLTPAGRVLLEQGRDLLAAAERLAETTRQVDSGWESCLNIAVDSLLGFEPVFELLDAFYREKPDIEVNLYEEVLGGAWEAALEARADLVIGASDAPTQSQGLRVEAMRTVSWCFAVSRDHPLCRLPAPISAEALGDYRAVVVRDSSRSMPPLTRRVFDKQATLRVANLEQKVRAQVRGLGVGFLPRHRIEAELRAGELVPLELESGAPDTPLHLVWKAGRRGRALDWFVARLRQEASR